uniref:Uncharacterized protein n=1 Tax=Setaria viridis TaxID=4556 RepID=A0A4U6W821_SETVI|nr:hypothetical protein SEVIR_1G073401v2 [Setaria viridis]
MRRPQPHRQWRRGHGARGDQLLSAREVDSAPAELESTAAEVDSAPAEVESTTAEMLLSEFARSVGKATTRGEEEEMDLARKNPTRAQLLSARDPRAVDGDEGRTTLLNRLYPPRSTGRRRRLARRRRARRLGERRSFLQKCRLADGSQQPVVRALIILVLDLKSNNSRLTKCHTNITVHSIEILQ